MILNDLTTIICINEPDISYTGNKPLVVNQKYLGRYEEADLGSFGKCPIYKVFDDNRNPLGEYYARDFKTVEENRNSKLEELLS